MTCKQCKQTEKKLVKFKKEIMKACSLAYRESLESDFADDLHDDWHYGLWVGYAHGLSNFLSIVGYCDEVKRKKK